MKTLIKNNAKKFKTSFTLMIAFCFFALSINSCKKFLDIPPPNTQLTTETVFNNAASATSAQLYIYTQMFNNVESYTMANNMGIYADELTNYDSGDQTQVRLYSNALQALDNPGPWGLHAYVYIYDANAVINGLQTTVGCSSAVKQQLTGEALIVRAFWHFYLTNIYGDVPLVLTTSYTTNGSIARTSRVKVLQQVVADLEQAKNLLNSSYVDASDTLTTTEKARPNKATAVALLARAWLYLGDYDNKNAADYVKADSAASAVISNPNYSLSPISSVFLVNSNEAIWQLETPTTSKTDTYDGKYFILSGAPSAGSSNNSTTISPQLMSSFEPGDQRETKWIGSITKGTSTYYFPNKYQQSAYQKKECTMMLRLGEQYLIRAEAEVQEGKITNAVADLNTIRNRAGLANYAGATDQTSLLTAILHERQVELFTEWGARWFDLQRTGTANSIMGSPGNVCTAKGGTWNSFKILFPVPQYDRTNDYNLTQNPGY